MVRFVASIAIGLTVMSLPPQALATLPRKTTCFEIVCVSTVVDAAGGPKDRTFTHTSSGNRLLVVRLGDGSKYTVLVRPVEKKDCPASAKEVATVTSRSNVALTSRGCLAVEAAHQYFSAEFAFFGADSRVFKSDLRHLAPQIYLRDVTERGTWFGASNQSDVLVLSDL